MYPSGVLNRDELSRDQANSRSSRRRRARSTSRQAWSAVGIALLSAVLPGAGHIRAGHRRSGGAILTVFLLLVAGAVYVGTSVDRMTLLGYAVDKDVLTGVIVGAVLLAIAWSAVIVTAYRARRPSHLRIGPALVSALLVGVLSLAVSTPPIYAARYAYVGRDVITQVFPSTQDSGVVRKTTEGADPWAGRPRINVLLLGGDGGRDRTGVRTDSLTVASIDTHTGDTVMFSLPRNLQHAPMPPRLRAEFPYGFTDLLNAVYRYGMANPDDFPGPGTPGVQAIQQVIEQILGVEIDYYVLVNLHAFTEIVNAIGGVDMNVGKRLPIGGEGGPITGYIEPGYQHLDGQHALWYARSRAADDDYHRMARQRCVLGAIAKQASPQRVLRGFQRIAAAARENVATDIPDDDLPALLKLGEMAKTARISSLQFVPPLVDTSDPDFAMIEDETQRAIRHAEKVAKRDAERAANQAAGDGTGDVAAGGGAGGKGGGGGGGRGGSQGSDQAGSGTPTSLNAVCQYGR